MTLSALKEALPFLINVEDLNEDEVRSPFGRRLETLANRALEEAIVSRDTAALSAALVTVDAPNRIAAIFKKSSNLRYPHIFEEHRILATQMFVTMTHDKDSAVRRNAGELLIGSGLFSEDIFLQRLEELLDDPDVSVREHFRDIFARIPFAISEERIARFLKDKNADMRCAALASVASSKTSFTLRPVVLRLLEDSDSEVRKATMVALSGLSPEDAEEAYLDAIRKDVPLRVFAARELTRSTSTRVIDALLDLLDEADTQLKVLSIWVLGEIGYGQ